MTASRIRNWLLALALGFGTTTAAFAAGELRRRSGEELGPLDFYTYCIEEYGHDANATLKVANAWGWLCAVPGRIELFERINVGDACTLLYGRDAYAEADDVNSPYSWRCYRE